MTIARTFSKVQPSSGVVSKQSDANNRNVGDTLYQASVPVFQRHLFNLSRVLDKAERFAHANTMDPKEFTGGRLAEDMFALNRQIHVVTDTAKGCAFRLAGQAVPEWQDVEVNFAELQRRITKTRLLLTGFGPDDFNGAPNTEISLRFAGRDLSMSAQDYLHTLVLPNFYFHASIAYGIVRSKGVPLGKFDFLGSFPLNPHREQVQ